VELIADEAGFSTGVVYSQFGGKADLFLALLDARIAERTADNTRMVEGITGDEGIMRLLERAASVDRAEPEWGLTRRPTSASASAGHSPVSCHSTSTGQSACHQPA